MDDFDDFDDFYDFEGPSNYRGFDLSDVEEQYLPELMEKIDAIHDDMQKLRELCKKLISIYESAERMNKDLQTLEPDVYQEIFEEAIKLYGEEKGKELVPIIMGKPDRDPPKIRIAKAKALIISYERQFEDEETEPIHPSEFVESDLFRTMVRVTGTKDPFPYLY